MHYAQLNKNLPNMLGDKYLKFRYYVKDEQDRKHQIVIIYTRMELDKFKKIVQHMNEYNVAPLVEEYYYDEPKNKAYLLCETFKYYYDINIADLINLYGRLVAQNLYLKKFDERYIGYKKNRLVMINTWDITTDQKYKYYMDNFIRQQLIHLIFPRDCPHCKPYDYKKILKKYEQYPDYDKLAYWMEYRKYTKIYKEYLKDNDYHQVFVDFDLPYCAVDFIPFAENKVERKVKEDREEWLRLVKEAQEAREQQKLEEEIKALDTRSDDEKNIERLESIYEDRNAYKDKLYQQRMQQQQQVQQDEDDDDINQDELLEQLELAGMAKVEHNFQKVILPPVINDSDEMFPQLLLTNGEDKIYFNEKVKDKKEEEKEDEENDDFIPGLILDDNKKQFSKTSDEEHLDYKLNILAPDYLILLFLGFYYNLSTSSFTIVSKEEKKIVFKINDNKEEVQQIQSRGYFEEFKLYSDLFYKYCPKVYPINAMINKIYKEYEIENYMDTREIFDGTCTTSSKSHCIMCYHNEYFKGNSNYTNKSFANFPYKGNDSTGFLIQYDNKIQCQVVQYDKFYCIDVYRENDEILQIQEGYNLPMKIKRLKDKKYVCIINFNEAYDFIHNFIFLQPRKQSNTQYIFHILNKTIYLQLRHGNIQCKGKFDSPDESIIFFTLMKNIGNYTVSENQNTTLADLQLVSPLYFGKTKYGDYEKQLENMNKRPQLAIQQFVDSSKFKWKNYIEKITKKGGDKRQMTIIDNDEKADLFNKTQETFLKGVDYKIYQNNVFMSFKCPDMFPYLSPTLLNIPNTNEIVYIGCQLSPIRFDSINLYEIYDSYKYLLRDEYKEFLAYLRKALFGRVLINPIKYQAYWSTTPGRCVRMMPDLLNYFDPRLLCLRCLYKQYQLDVEWLQSVCSIDITKWIKEERYIVYHYKQKIFTIQNPIPKDFSEKLVFINYNHYDYNYNDDREYMYLIINPDLKDDKYEPYQYLHDDKNQRYIEGTYYDQAKQWVITQDGILPSVLFKGYSLVRKEFPEVWPDAKVIFKKYMVKEMVMGLLQDSDNNVIGFQYDQDLKIFIKKQKLSDYKDEFFGFAYQDEIQHQIDEYPRKNVRLLLKSTLSIIPFNPTPYDDMCVLIVNNRQLFKQERDIKKLRKQIYYLKQDKIIYGFNIIHLQKKELIKLFTTQYKYYQKIKNNFLHSQIL